MEERNTNSHNAEEREIKEREIKEQNISAEKIKIAMIKNNIKLSKLADEVGYSAPNISNKLKRNNIYEGDLRLLADALGYDVDISLISRKTGERI